MLLLGSDYIFCYLLLQGDGKDIVYRIIGRDPDNFCMILIVCRAMVRTILRRRRPANP